MDFSFSKRKIREYRNGKCHHLAAAIHDLVGWQIYELVPAGITARPVHWFVRRGDGFIDIGGLYSAQDLSDEFCEERGFYPGTVVFDDSNTLYRGKVAFRRTDRDRLSSRADPTVAETEAQILVSAYKRPSLPRSAALT